jgi:hypothetical protein
LRVKVELTGDSRFTWALYLYRNDIGWLKLVSPTTILDQRWLRGRELFVLQVNKFLVVVATRQYVHQNKTCYDFNE